MVSVHPDPPPKGVAQVMHDYADGICKVLRSFQALGVTRVFVFSGRDPLAPGNPALQRLVAGAARAAGLGGQEFPNGPRTAKDWSLDDFVRASGTNRTTLFQLFKRELDTTPHQHHRDLRLQASRELLADPRRPLKEIAERCGYLHLAHWCRDFKARFGITPSACRKGPRAG